MKFHLQRFRHRPEDGEYGDCNRTCLASLLGMEPEDIPNFADGDPDHAEFYRRVDDFLAPCGLRRFSVPVDGEAPIGSVLAIVERNNPDTYWLLSGKSPRGVTHVVICHGGRIIWDPASGDVEDPNDALVGPDENSGHWWLEVLVPHPVTHRYSWQQIMDDIEAS